MSVVKRVSDYQFSPNKPTYEVTYNARQIVENALNMRNDLRNPDQVLTHIDSAFIAGWFKNNKRMWVSVITKPSDIPFHCLSSLFITSTYKEIIYTRPDFQLTPFFVIPEHLSQMIKIFEDLYGKAL